ncbi:hypothetical protein [Nocardia sp. CA-120079]|uniref:hypothetical protein n=1 Tax=Nocardia sp. CA-120079 TaxID=3239974 RepID=UPI003D957EC6
MFDGVFHQADPARTVCDLMRSLLWLQEQNGGTAPDTAAPALHGHAFPQLSVGRRRGAAFFARETCRIPLEDLGAPNAAALSREDYSRLRAEAIAA